MHLNKPRFKGNAIGFYTLLRKEIIRFLRIWPQTLLPSAITISLYFIIFGHLIGSQIGDIHGVSYMQYITPGLIMMSIITNAYSNVASSLYGMRFEKSIEELLIAPLPNYLILLAFCCGGMARAIVTGIIVTIVALLFTHITVHSFSLTIGITLLTAGFFSLAGFTNAVFARRFDDVSIIPTFVLTPLTYLGGVFFAVSQLPPIWQVIATANPILYIISAFRYGILGITDINPYIAFFVIAMAVAVLYSVNLYLLRRGVGLRS
ncbi:ABC transporter permease [soil metagenome]